MPVKPSRWNEHLKLAASFLNDLALALVALGFVGPLAQHLANEALMALPLAIIYVLTAFIIHGVAQVVIAQLEVE